MTTRPRAATEQDGREYWFVSREQFHKRIEEGSLLEYAEVFGNLYGTPRDKTEEALNAGKTVILEIDVQGARQVKTIYPQATMVFILPPSAKVLAERMSSPRPRKRGGRRTTAGRRQQRDRRRMAVLRQYGDQ